MDSIVENSSYRLQLKGFLRTLTGRRRNLYSYLPFITLFVLALLCAGCTTPTLGPTPTPTRTPRPTYSPTPTLTPTPVPPTPTPTPAFPVTAGCAASIPDAACDRFRARVAEAADYFVWSDDAAQADTLLGGAELPNATPLGVWTYAVVAPFFTVDDDITTADLRATWSGTPAGPFALHALLATTDTLDALTSLWGAPALGAVQTVAATELLTIAEQTGAWAIVPFDALEPRWKVLRLDGLVVVDKGLDMTAYPLAVTLYWSSARRPETLDLLPRDPDTFSNRIEQNMTRVVMTGVTAMTRETAMLMDRKGVTYPAQDILPWFANADFVHVSNEVSFKPDCVAEGSGTMSFCSHDSYIGLLEAIHANIIELTGNHLEDKGPQWVDHSLEMYRARGWQWFGGGANQADGAKPLTVTHGVNRIAFIGCNTVGPFAGEDSGGAARCDFEQMRADIQQLQADGYQTIVTLQYLEDYNYTPTPQQIRDFRYLAEAGPVYVQGSQAHQAQTMEFYNGVFIHYGLGNFFFDQMWSDGTRQEFVNRLTFYNGRLLNVDLRTAILEESGRPRPMTVGDPDPAADRAKFLQMIFDLRIRD
ncbi:MAG TPA: CapA family protein [Anaerolineae bacterium]|nr:CapA family protein [Anaerolineae bacterium]HQK13861.1 CapA family protein [Anaerolineae bacterium]